jgi:thiosulfate reductase cytochrome b subunit
MVAVVAAAIGAFGVAPTLAQEACIDCHDGAHAGGVHESLGCADCHTNVTIESHPDAPLSELGGGAICAQCHDKGDPLGASVHGKVSCVECHGKPHEIKPPSDVTSPTSVFNLVETCGSCHAKPDAKSPELVEKFRDSVHGRALLRSGLRSSATCTSCHGDAHEIVTKTDPQSPVAGQNVATTCGACHELIIHDWLAGSAHGTAWQAQHDGTRAKDAPPSPVCVTCHASHAVVPPTTSEARLQSSNTCGGCHGGRFTSYRDSFHGQATNLGFSLAAGCADCHTPHKNLPAADPRSSVNPANLQQTCGQSGCHRGMVNASFVTYDPHADPHDPNANPILHWIWFAMTGLLIGTFGFFTLHGILWLQRAIVGKRRGELPMWSEDGPWVRRFGPVEIALHATVITTFLLLALTGLPLKFNGTPWAKVLAGLLGGVGTTAVLHRIAAVLTFGYFAVHVGVLMHRIFVRKEQGLLWGWRSMVPRARDLTDMWRNFKWFLYMGERPRFDRYTYWEKFDYFAVFWGVVIIGGSGLMLWLPGFFTRFLPGWTLNAAMIVHSDEALLATGFIFIFHFFHTHLRPEAFPLDTVVFVGSVPLARFEEERPDEYERLKASGELAKWLVPAPSAKALRRARVLGSIALAIGLLLAVGIIYSLLF